MRLRSGSFILSVVLCAASSARAGIYNTIPGEQVPGPLLMIQFYQMHDLYRSAANPNSPVHTKFLALLEEMEKTYPPEPDRSVDQRINLSSYYLRLQQWEKATQVLAAVDANERNFMVLGNLGMAHFRAGRIDRAMDSVESALKVWPASWPGMTQYQLVWFYRVEKYFLTLLRSRQRMEQLHPGKSSEMLDQLFGGVRFVGDDGRYEPGRIATRQYVLLPPDHLAIVEQLLIWMPGDPQLWWMLGELFNANRNVVGAWKILDRLSFSENYKPPELTEHRQILMAARTAAEAWELRMIQNREQLRLLWMVSPRGGAAPGSSPIFNESGYAVSLNFMKVPENKVEARPEADNAAKSEKKTPILDVRHVVVSFLAGAVLMLLVAMQVREMRRRRTGEGNAVKS